jgi:hypothetical protein
MVHASLALSSDARVVAQLNRGRPPRPGSIASCPYSTDGRNRSSCQVRHEKADCFAVPVDYGDEVQCLVRAD